MCDENIKYQKCTRCGEDKPHTTEFFLFKKQRNYLMIMCKECVRKDIKDRKDHPEKYKKRQKLIEDVDSCKCRKCGELKLFSRENFSVQRNKPTTLCVKCYKKQKQEAEEKLVFKKLQEVPDFKECTRCKKTKPNDLQNFAKDGLLTSCYCRKCSNDLAKESVERNKKIKLSLPYGFNADKNLIKKCYKCGFGKPFTTENFTTCNNKIQTKCRECDRKEKHTRYYQDHEKSKAKLREYSKNNPEKIQVYNKSPQRRAKDAANHRKPESRSRSNARDKVRRATDPQFKIKKNLRCRLYAAMKDQMGFKRGKSEELLGCSYEEATKYFETKFTEGMSWDLYGYGPGKFNLEHIVPCEAFWLENDSHARQCFHYTNVIPMWHEDNMAKSDWITYNGQQVRARTLTKQQKHIYIASLNLPPYDVPNHSVAPYNTTINHISLTLPINTYINQNVNNSLFNNPDVTILAANLPIRASVTRRIQLV